MIGKHWVKGWSHTQGIIALSSGEAEFYGLVKGGSTGLGIVGMLEELGVKGATLVLLTDASAAKGMANRIGTGKVRHIEVHQLWLQEKWQEEKCMSRKWQEGRTWQMH